MSLHHRLLLLLLTGLLQGQDPALIIVEDRFLEVNGQREVPAGLFGVHAVSVDEELRADLNIGCVREINFVPGGGTHFRCKDGVIAPPFDAIPLLIDCQGDRFHTPSILQSPKYKEKFTADGTAYATWAKTLREKTGRRMVVEFWNEPYLNWAERSVGDGRNPFNPDYYRVDLAVEGGPVTIKGWDTPLTYFRWRSLWPFAYIPMVDKTGQPVIDKKTGQPQMRREIAWSVKIPEGAKEGNRFRGREDRYWRPKEEREYVIEKEWHPVDPTMFSFWSGRQNLEFYRWMYKPFATAVRKADPATTLIAGWCFNYSRDECDWKVWTELYRPLIEEMPDLIDGICDHHYDIDPRVVQAWYEVGTADGMAITGRFYKHYNTECQGRPDPSVHARAAIEEGKKPEGLRKFLEANYNLMDIIGLVARMPDKAVSRTAHNFSGGDYPQSGSAFALRLLKNLRGRLLVTRSSDPLVWGAAALAQDGKSMVMAVCNTDTKDRKMECESWKAANVMATWLEIDPQTQGLVIRKQKPDVMSEDGRKRPWTVPARSGVVFTWEKQVSDQNPILVRRQCFAKEKAIQTIAPDKPSACTIAVAEDLLKTAQRVTLRVCVHHDDGKPKAVTINGIRLPLTVILPVTDLELDAKLVKPGDNRLEFSGESPWLLGAASILIEH